MAYKLLVFFFPVCIKIVWCSVGTNDSSLIENLGIYGGQEIPIEDAPYMVALYIPRTDHSTYFCGGSIIHEQFVLTAAHCFRDSIIPLVKGYVGTANLKQHKAPIKLEEKICNTGFTDKTSKNDICILKLTEPLKFDTQVNKVDLPKRGLVVNPGTLVNVTGWGDTEKRSSLVSSLRQVTIPILADPCRWKQEICAGSQGFGTCNGDSGSPLVYNNMVIGVVSHRRQDTCAGPYGTVYIRVASYTEWIKSHLN